MSYRILRFILLCFCFCPVWIHAEPSTRLTVIYDAFGPASPLTKDWGFSLVVEHNDAMFLFDTGNNNETFAHNLKISGIDVEELQFAVISHRHGDHMGGLAHLVSQRPGLTVYAPREGFGVFGAELPGDFYPQNPSLIDKMRYFDGKPPSDLHFGSAWPEANFKLVSQTMTLLEGVHLIVLKGTWGTDLPLQEVSLVLETAQGLIIVVGCSHPTIEKIIETAQTEFKQPIHLVIGGTHLLPASTDEIQRIAMSLRDTFNVQWLAPAHCTGEPAFGALSESFGERYLYAGLGSVIRVDSTTGDVTSAPLANLPLSEQLPGDQTELPPHNHQH